MLGAIIGDIVGSRFEFNNTDNYNFELFTKDSTFTDDTICTIAVADAINTGANYRDKFSDGVEHTPIRMGHTVAVLPVG